MNKSIKLLQLLHEAIFRLVKTSKDPVVMIRSSMANHFLFTDYNTYQTSMLSSGYCTLNIPSDDKTIKGISSIIFMSEIDNSADFSTCEKLSLFLRSIMTTKVLNLLVLPTNKLHEDYIVKVLNHEERSVALGKELKYKKVIDLRSILSDLLIITNSETIDELKFNIITYRSALTYVNSNLKELTIDNYKFPLGKIFLGISDDRTTINTIFPSSPPEIDRKLSSKNSYLSVGGDLSLNLILIDDLKTSVGDIDKGLTGLLVNSGIDLSDELLSEISKPTPVIVLDRIVKLCSSLR